MSGTLKQLGEAMLQSFQELGPAQQEAVRKANYEKITGKPYRKAQA